MAHAPTLESGQRPGAATLDLIRRLIAFDTVSERSNLALIEFVAGYLDDLGVACELVHDEGHAKANLYATLGPAARSGIALSGHTDVVPVEGQPWESDPFDVLERDGRLHGRGTSDMKSSMTSSPPCSVYLARYPTGCTGPTPPALSASSWNCSLRVGCGWMVNDRSSRVAPISIASDASAMSSDA